MEQIQADDEEDVSNDTVKDILTRIFTRRSACNSKLVCAVTATGGYTKSFQSHIGLARYLFDEFGEHWYRYVKAVNNEGEPQPFRKKGRSSEAPDLEGSYQIIGRLRYNNQVYAALDTPHDGSCFYHSFSSMLRELKGGDTRRPETTAEEVLLVQ